MNIKNKEYQLSDFYPAVVLKTVGFPLVRLERIDSRYFTFVFSDPDNKAQKVIESYWNHQVKVEARNLVENIVELKTRIHSRI